MLPAGLAADPPHWDEAFPPHKIAGNLYYVGTKGLSSYLVTTPRGHILINASFERTVPLIKAAIEQLGFRYSDVKILLGSHAHGDHMAGNWLVKEQTGARVLVMKEDAVAVRKGKGLLMTRPCVVDQELRDGEVVSLGGASLQAVLTPGHTEGCTTWTMEVDVEGVKRLAVVVGSPNINPGTKLVGNAEYPCDTAGCYNCFTLRGDEENFQKYFSLAAGGGNRTWKARMLGLQCVYNVPVTTALVGLGWLPEFVTVTGRAYVSMENYAGVSYDPDS